MRRYEVYIRCYDKDYEYVRTRAYVYANNVEDLRYKVYKEDGLIFEDVDEANNIVYVR